MELGFEETQAQYISSSQQAKAWTERWVAARAFCPNCGNLKLARFESNRPVADFFCSSCGEEYELKSQKNKLGNKVMDGAFNKKCERLAASNNPSLFLLNYDLGRLRVSNFLVVPKHFFVRSIIEERKPLGPAARRAGWIGSNILLHQIPAAGKIYIVRDGEVQTRENVLEKWRRTRFLRDESSDARGWLIEVMKCVEYIGQSEFQLGDVYAFEHYLASLYPNNRHVRQKIRQQLQVLRDQGFLDFVSPGRYRLRSQ